jgi:hypothetical protein
MSADKAWSEYALLLKNAENIGAAHARRDERPNYRAPAEYARHRLMHDAWLRGYARVAAITWEHCLRVG